MIIAIVILSIVASGFAVALYLVWKKLSHEVAAEKRRVSDTNAEWQVRYDAAVTATFLHLLEKMSGLVDEEADKNAVANLFEKCAEVQSKGVQAMLADLREKVAVMNAATQDATRQTLMAAAEVSNVRAENTIHRTLLEKALMLPRDAPESERMIFLTRCRAALDSARATAEWPTEQFWLDYVKLHSTKMDVR
jgi:hypothetical protein